MTVILGIDPGITGAIARISQSGAVEVWDMPATPRDLAELMVRAAVSPVMLVDVIE